MNEKKEKVIEIGFKNDSIKLCINPSEIFKFLKNPNITENLEKCLKLGSKLFTH